MINLLEQVVCSLASIPAAIVNTLVLSINGLILLCGVILLGICEALPNMPAPLTEPDAGVLGFINWIVPLAPMIAFCTGALVLFAAFMAVKVLLTKFGAI